MKNNIYFKNVIEIGNLSLDCVFFEFESEPIIFTCTDNKNNLFLCLCSEIRYGQKWIVSKCEIKTLKALIDEKIDIATAICEPPRLIVITMDMEGKENSKIIATKEIDKLDLPKENTYLRCDRGQLSNYLWKKMYLTQAFFNKEINYNGIINSYNSSIKTIAQDFLNQINKSIDTAYNKNIKNTSKMLYEILSKTNKENNVIQSKYKEVIDEIQIDTCDDYIQAA